MGIRSLLLVLLLGTVGHDVATAQDVALLTAMEGHVSRPAASAPRLEAFARLRQGDVLLLQGAAAVRLIFFDSGREENWRGDGRIEIGAAQGKGSGLPEPKVLLLPAAMVRQIAKTPSPHAPERAVPGRLRGIDFGAGGLDKLDSDYGRLRKEAAADDINPEIFLLAGLFELREFGRLEQTLKELGDTRPGNMELAVLGSLYKRAMSQIQQR
jgi:hypothetical protein